MVKNRTPQADASVAYMQMMRHFMRLSTEWVNVAADSLGVNSTDLIAGTYLAENGPMTAGELAKVMGITTGAMTVAIDRLERAGFAVRENDPHDRRKVIIKPKKLPAKLLAMRESIAKEIHAIFSHYSDSELLRMTEVTREIITVFEKEISHFKNPPGRPGAETMTGIDLKSENYQTNNKL
jgi:DNA-binding MarR family transcriptional regulator